MPGTIRGRPSDTVTQGHAPTYGVPRAFQFFLEVIWPLSETCAEPGVLLPNSQDHMILVNVSVANLQSMRFRPVGFESEVAV